MSKHEQPPIVRAIVARYARLHPWIDPEDLHQEAWVTMLEVTARGTWRPGGAPLECYQASAVLFRLRNYTARQRAKARACTVDLDECEALAIQQHLEEKIDHARAATRIVSVLVEAGEGARAVLLDGEKSSEAAKSLGLCPSEVYEQTGQARRALREDKFLRDVVG